LLLLQCRNLVKYRIVSAQEGSLEVQMRNNTTYFA
jgi:hypothetical protein